MQKSHLREVLDEVIRAFADVRQPADRAVVQLDKHAVLFNATDFAGQNLALDKQEKLLIGLITKIVFIAYSTLQNKKDKRVIACFFTQCYIAYHKNSYTYDFLPP